MGYSVVIGGKKTVPLATIRGWADAKRWIDKLDVERFESLIHLAEYAWTQGLPTLRSQILAALKEHPPKDDSVRVTMAGLAKELRGAKGESIFVSDGLSEDDGEDIADEWHVGDYDPDPDQPTKFPALRGKDPLFSNTSSTARPRKPPQQKPKRKPKRKR